jgi:hypothetical protein
MRFRFWDKRGTVTLRQIKERIEAGIGRRGYTTEELRGLSDDDLHWVVGTHKQDRSPIDHSRAMAELERRKAWAPPPGRAFWISIAALVTSAVSLAATILK